MNTPDEALIDTSSIIDYFRGDSNLRDRLLQLENLYLPLTVLGELYYGAHKSKQGDLALTRVRRFAEGCTMIAPDDETAGIYGRVKCELASAGKMIPENDIWIAAVARQYSLPLATRDKHFASVTGLTILSW